MISQDSGLKRENDMNMTANGSTSELPANVLLRVWARVRSWFEIPFGYEDETGFHYGHEPLPVQATAQAAAPREPFREVFTDRACDSAIFMANTDKQSAPKPQPEVRSEVREQTTSAS